MYIQILYPVTERESQPLHQLPQPVVNNNLKSFVKAFSRVKDDEYQEWRWIHTMCSCTWEGVSIYLFIDIVWVIHMPGQYLLPEPNRPWLRRQSKSQVALMKAGKSLSQKDMSECNWLLQQSGFVVAKISFYISDVFSYLNLNSLAVREWRYNLISTVHPWDLGPVVNRCKCP